MNKNQSVNLTIEDLRRNVNLFDMQLHNVLINEINSKIDERRLLENHIRNVTKDIVNKNKLSV